MRADRRREGDAREGLAVLGVGAALAGVPAVASAQLPSTTDPRAGLAQGLENPGVAAKGMELRRT